MKKKQTDLFDVPDFSEQSSPNIEECVLGCFIAYPDTYTDNAHTISIKDFSTTENRMVYHAIVDLIENNKKIDVYTVSNHIVKCKWDELIKEKKNGFDLIVHLEDLYERIDTDENVKDHIKELNDYTRRRELSELSKKIINDVNDFKAPDDIIEYTSDQLFDIQKHNDVDDLSPADRLKMWVDEKNDHTQKTRITTGLAPVDEFIYGFQPPDQVILAAAPSMGKTSLAVQIFMHNVLKNIPCGIFSLEMNYDQLFDRMVALSTGVQLRNLLRKQLNPLEWSKINQFIGKMEKQKFFIDDKVSKLSLICNKIRKWVIQHNIQFVIVDYLQLVICDANATNREQEIATISRRFKELARELNIVIMPLSQISRKNATRQDKRPILSDLRESGSIEQDADVVMFVHRPSYYEAGINPPIENAEIIIGKGRSIGVGAVDVFFQSSHTKFYGDQESMNESQRQMLHTYVAMANTPDELPSDDKQTPF